MVRGKVKFFTQTTEYYQINARGVASKATKLDNHTVGCWTSYEVKYEKLKRKCILCFILFYNTLQAYMLQIVVYLAALFVCYYMKILPFLIPLHTRLSVFLSIGRSSLHVSLLLLIFEIFIFE